MQHITKIYRSKKIHRVEKVTQTGKYKLNLIEPTDPFLPDALNQNTMKLEEAVSGHLEDMDQRLTVLEARHFAYGIYVGNDPRSTSGVLLTQLIPLPFAPTAVFVATPGTEYSTFGFAVKNGNAPYLKLVENGFTAQGNVNYQGQRFGFIAFG